MAKRRITETNFGETRPTVWRFEGGDVIWMVAGLGSGLLVFRLVHGTWQWSVMEASLVALLPVGLISAYVLGLRQGKSRSYDVEFFEWVSVRFQTRLDEWLGMPRRHAHFGPRRVIVDRHPLTQCTDDKTS